MSRVSRRLVTATVTAGAIALVPVSGAEAAKLSKTDKSQNTAIKKAAKSASAASKSAKAAAKSAATGIANAKTADTKAAGAQAGVNGILGQVPAVLDGLSKLAAGLQQAADGLKKLGDAAAAQEYGVVKLQVGTTDVPGAILTSGDIPDDTNGATVSGTLIVPVPANTPAAPVRLLAGIRSGESDGTGDSNPAGQAGIVSMDVISDTPNATVAGGNTGAADIPLTSAPNTTASYKPAPIYDIPNKAPRVDATPNPLSFPTDKAIDLTDAARLNNSTGAGVAPFTVANATGAAGAVEVRVTVRFHDLSASSTDVTA